MTTKDQLLQEIETSPEALLVNLLDFITTLKANPTEQRMSYTDLLDRIDYLEAVVGIRKGLEESDRGAGTPADQALSGLQTHWNA